MKKTGGGHIRGRQKKRKAARPVGRYHRTASPPVVDTDGAVATEDRPSSEDVQWVEEQSKGEEEISYEDGSAAMEVVEAELEAEGEEGAVMVAEAAEVEEAAEEFDTIDEDVAGEKAGGEAGEEAEGEAEEEAGDKKKKDTGEGTG